MSDSPSDPEVKDNKAFQRHMWDWQAVIFLFNTGVKVLFKGRSNLLNVSYSSDMIHKDRQYAVGSRVMVLVQGKWAVAVQTVTLKLNKFVNVS